MARINVSLIDGTISEVIENDYMNEGSPTCETSDYGSERIREIRFIIDVDWSENQQIVEITSNQMYEYAEELNTSNIIKLITKVIEEPMNFHEFVDFCKKTLVEQNKDIEIEVYEYVKRS